jgi:hypothetical protein
LFDRLPVCVPVVSKNVTVVLHVGLEQIAFARGQCIEPVGAAVGAAGQKARARAQVGGVDQVADAENPLGELDIATNLATAGNAAGMCGRRSNASAARVDTGPGAADIAADITARPNRRRRQEAGGT